MSTDSRRSPPSTDPQAPGEPVDFDEVAGTDATSWERGEPETALIESTGRYGYRVTLPDGDAHLVAVAVDDGQHVGQCDCKAWEYHDGPCAHLCAVRMAAFLGVEDTQDERVRIPRLDLDAHETGERAVADSGHVDRARHQARDRSSACTAPRTVRGGARRRHEPQRRAPTTHARAGQAAHGRRCLEPPSDDETLAAGYRALREAAGDAPLPVDEAKSLIASRANIPKSSASRRVLSPLHDRGYIKRCGDPINLPMLKVR